MSGVDVIVPCYNYGRFLRECVESVLAQSHRDVRVTIIDDASHDETPEVSAALAARDSRVVIRRHEFNRGHIETYNEAIRLAERDTMLLLSADDFLLPGALARAVAVLDARPEVGLVHGAWVAYRMGDPLPAPFEGAGEVDFPATAQFLTALATRNTVGTATVVVRTAVQKTIGFYRPDLPHAADLEMWLRFALHGGVAYVRTPQAAYRRHESNMSHGYDGPADLEECLAAFRPHWNRIADSLPDGRLLAGRLRRILAARARGKIRSALRRGRISTALWLIAVRLGADPETGPRRRMRAGPPGLA